MARAAFAQVHLKHQLHPFLNQEALFMAIYAFLLKFMYCALLGAALENYSKAAVQNSVLAFLDTLK